MVPVLDQQVWVNPMHLVTTKHLVFEFQFSKSVLVPFRVVLVDTVEEAMEKGFLWRAWACGRRGECVDGGYASVRVAVHSVRGRLR